MCGIFFASSREQFVYPDDRTQAVLRARGPDSLKTLPVQVKHTQSDESEVSTYLTFSSSVLSLRGDSLCEQPVIDPTTGSCLCWNGEAWKINDNTVTGNDTEQVFRLLLDASAEAVIANQGAPAVSNLVLDALMCVTGPYAFVYYDATNSAIYFGRDRLGRRSLVISARESLLSEIQIVSSSFGDPTATEVEVGAVHYIDLRESTLQIHSMPWQTSLPTVSHAVATDHHMTEPIPSATAVSALQHHLLQSLRLRTLDVPSYTPSAHNPDIQDPSRIAILFSGGLDCTLLARLTHDILPLDQPIDLLNVAFENPRSVRAAMGQSTKPSPVLSPYETCPDRVTARSSFAELLAVCPLRVWRFVAIDVPYSDTLSHRDQVIKLMLPHNTEMDLSITLALYFASRGQGVATTSTSSPPVPYTTTARVLLSGLGADELFGGYARHAAAFARDGYSALLAELHLDITRIGTRNLGRDDRVLSHWGREVRYPYLDEDFVAFALAMSVVDKVGFRTGRPIPRHFEQNQNSTPNVEREEDLDPAKMVLRLAAWRLGMHRAAGERKRAIQFGARTAKMNAGRTKGTDLLST